MTRDEIIDMVESCGFTRTHTGEVQLWLSNIKDLEKLTDLARVKERDHCAARAAIALLGANKATSDRVLRAITHRKFEA